MVSYGHPRKNFADIARGLSVIYGVKITPEQYSLGAMWVKICRELNGHQPDNIDDIIGYALTHTMLEDNNIRWPGHD